MSSFFRSRLGKEFLGIFVIALAVFTLLSLISYHQDDPGFFPFDAVGAQHEARNYMGRLGSSLAHLLYDLLGLTAFTLPFVFLYIGYKSFASRPIPNKPTKSLGLLLLLLSLSSLLTETIDEVTLSNKDVLRAGGWLGEAVSGNLQLLLGASGALLCLVTVFLLSTVLTSQFSFYRAAALVLWVLATVFRKLSTLYIRRRERKRKARVRAKVLNHHRARLEEGQSKEAEEEHIEKEEEVRLQPTFDFPTDEDGFRLPPISLLEIPANKQRVDDKELMTKSGQIVEKFQHFHIQGKISEIHPGPVVTTYEYHPDATVKYSRLIQLTEDLSLALEAESVRIERISGRSTVGIEVPNRTRETIYLKELVADEMFQRASSKLTLGLGKTIRGEPQFADLARMPHLLIAGSTGSGKSVAINAMICGILFRATPEEVKFILIDPKMLELGIYEALPHLLTPVVTDPKQAANALAWATKEMEERYRQLASCQVRNIDQYNRYIQNEGRAKESKSSMAPARQTNEGTEEALRPIPYVVIVIDELADLMMISSKSVERSIARLAQTARAVGIHLILATQRPSVDVITGVIKANLPARISFQVSSKTDSRTIIDTNGAEQLLGNGDMLFLPPGTSRLLRLHAPLVTEGEIQRLVKFLSQQGCQELDTSVLEEAIAEEELIISEGKDKLYGEAVEIIVRSGRASVSHLQRRLQIGYNRAARLVELMEANQIVGPSRGSKPREVLVGVDYLEQRE